MAFGRSFASLCVLTATVSALSGCPAPEYYAPKANPYNFDDWGVNDRDSMLRYTAVQQDVTNPDLLLSKLRSDGASCSVYQTAKVKMARCVFAVCTGLSRASWSTRIDKYIIDFERKTVATSSDTIEMNCKGLDIFSIQQSFAQATGNTSIEPAESTR
jgi:hypothetical protein